MSYVPNPSDPTEPVASRTVESAAREFREIKGLLARSLSFPAADTPTNRGLLPPAADRAGRVLQFNATTGVPETGATVSSLMAAESNAAASAASAANSAASAAQITALYLGVQASDPATNLSGGALVQGNWYINSTTGFIRVRISGSWVEGVSAGVNLTGDQTIAGIKTFSSAPIVPGINGGQLAGFRNLLINGNFQINQRGYVSGTNVGAANTYTLDRWRVVTSGQNVTITASGNGNQITAPAGGIEQVIEGINIGGGTYVLNWTGTATATVNGTARDKGASFTLPANTNATVRLIGGTASQVQLEPGTVATPFEHRPIGAELALCQRYYFTNRISGDAVGLTDGFAVYRALPPMRASPSITHTLTDANFTTVGAPTGLQWGIQTFGVATAAKTGTVSLSGAGDPTIGFTLFGFGATFSRATNYLAAADNTFAASAEL